jgi:sugar phosphate isomerase/epimerase
MRTSRRQLLKFAANGAVGLSLQSLLTAQSEKATEVGFPAGIQLYTVRKALAKDTAGTLRALATIGYREVETAGTANLPAAEFRRLLQSAGLNCPSSHVKFTEDDFQTAFAEAKALGASFATSSNLASLVVPEAGTNGQGTTTFTADEFHRTAELMNRIGKAAAEDGLRYAYHNHNLEFVRLPSGEFGFDILLRETDASTVMFEADCGWMAAAGADPSAYFVKYPSRFRMMHVKDFAPIPQPTTESSGGTAPRGVDLGHGFIDYKPIFAAARRTGIQHAFVEQEPPFPKSEMDSAKADFNIIDSTF